MYVNLDPIKMRSYAVVLLALASFFLLQGCYGESESAYVDFSQREQIERPGYKTEQNPSLKWPSVP